MAIEFIAWASKQKVGDASAKSVLIAICNYVDEVGFGFPSQGRLMEFTELSQSTVRRAIVYLEQRGFIRREERTRNGGSRTSDGFHVLVSSQNHPVTTTPHLPCQGDTPALSPRHPRPCQGDTPLTVTVTDNLTQTERDRLFSKFWEAYPRKSGSKPDVRKAWDAAVADGVSPESLAHAAWLYAQRKAEDGTEERYIKTAANWLRERRYEDEDMRPIAPQPPLTGFALECVQRGALTEAVARSWLNDALSACGVLVVRNRLAQDWIRNHYGTTLRDVFGITEITHQRQQEAK